MVASLFACLNNAFSLFLLSGAASDDENETTDDHRAGRSHMSDPKSWSDSESESEMEVKNKVLCFAQLLFYSVL